MHAVDMYPTLLKLAGASLEQKLPFDGLDVFPVLTNHARTPHDAILLVGSSPSKAAVRSGDWKLLLNASEQNDEESPESGAETPTSQQVGRVELYNLAEDVSESKNLASAQPEKVKELRAKLDTFLKDAVAPGQPKAAGAGSGVRRRAAKDRQ
jgi:arylsulfatase A-like enzyme